MNTKKLFIFTLVFAVCCLMTTSSWAAKETKIYKSNAKDFIKKLNENKGIGHAFGLSKDEDFVLIRQITDFNGETHYRYQQTFNGYPVWGHQTVISKKGDKVIKLHGTVIQDAPNDVGNFPKNCSPQCTTFGVLTSTFIYITIQISNMIKYDRRKSVRVSRV